MCNATYAVIGKRNEMKNSDRHTVGGEGTKQHCVIITVLAFEKLDGGRRFSKEVLRTSPYKVVV